MARVLIADSSSFIRGSLKYVLEYSGHEVVDNTDDGEKALSIYRNFKIDVVITNVSLGDKEGIALLKAIKEIDKEAVVFMMSSPGHEDSVNEALNLGASGFIDKPFKQPEIADMIKRALKGKK